MKGPVLDRYLINSSSKALYYNEVKYHELLIIISLCQTKSSILNTDMECDKWDLLDGHDNYFPYQRQRLVFDPRKTKKKKNRSINQVSSTGKTGATQSLFHPIIFPHLIMCRTKVGRLNIYNCSDDESLIRRIQAINLPPQELVQ